MKIGLYFGSFNPIHEGHIFVVNKALETGIDKLFLVVSPQSPFKPLSELASFNDRLEMARIAIKTHRLDEKVEAVNWEEHMYPSYTAHTLQDAVPILKENDTTIFMGLDNFLTIDKWKEPDYILENYRIHVIPRGEDFDISLITNKVNQLKESITPNLKGVTYSIIEHTIDISATEIRNKIRNDENVEDIINNNVLGYIKDNKLYSHYEVKGVN